MKIPKHIGIIMDGNGRWAKKRGMMRAMGHRAGTEATHRIVEACGEIGVKYLTIYVFSAENWGRPKIEVDLLMNLLVEMVHKEIDLLNKNNVKLSTIGDLSRLPKKTYEELMWGVEETSQNTGLNLILALSYGGRSEIVSAAKKISTQISSGELSIDDVDEKLFATKLYMSNIPDPELIIRTGGDTRISNFLLWQSAYAELYFTNILWPDFNKDELMKAIDDFSNRERRFGKVKEL